MFINIFLYCGVPQDSVLETILLSLFMLPLLVLFLIRLFSSLYG